VQVRGFGVIADGKQMALGNGVLRHELACMEISVRPVVEADAEVLAGGYAEGQRSPGAEFVFAGGDGGHSFGPGGVGGFCWRSHRATTELDCKS